MGIPGHPAWQEYVLEAFGNYLISSQAKKVAVFGCRHQQPAHRGQIGVNPMALGYASEALLGLRRPANLGGSRPPAKHLLCEAACLNLILVETVGVVAETASQYVDFFFLMLWQEPATNARHKRLMMGTPWRFEADGDI